MRWSAGILLVACAAPDSDGSSEVDVRAWATEVTASGGWLVLQTTYPAGKAASLPEPEVEGLTFAADGPPREERLGDRSVITQRWRFTGKKGSYEIPALVVAVDGAEEVRTLPLWVDLGVEVSDFTPAEDIAEPGRIWAVPWGWICGGLSIVGLGVALSVLGLGRLATAPPRPARIDPPDVRCVRAWDAVRADPTLSDDEKAKELSRIFREYTEEVLAFPAASWTTSEILDRLESMVHLPKGNVPRAKRLLRATDLVKFAEVSPEKDFFEELDADLRSFVDSTRPQAWSGEQPPARPPGVPDGG